MKRAFTIIEMLVVIGIMAVLMSLTVASIASTKRTDKLLATEHLIGDLVRQARHTARTSGAPVMVLIDKDERRVQGVSQIDVWHQDFDGLSDPVEQIPALPNTYPVMGSTSVGYQIDLDLSTPNPPPQQILQSGKKLIRSSGHNDGFYLSCHVYPPLLDTGNPIIPLVVVATSPVGSSPDRSDSVAGMALQMCQIPLQKINDSDARPPAINGQLAPLKTWEIVGWIGDDPLTPTEVSSIVAADTPADVHRDEPALHSSITATISSHPNDIATPLSGGHWVEIGLLFDGERLVLYRDGVRIAEKHFSSPPIIHRGDEVVTVGQLTITPNTYTANKDTGVRFDNIRIARLSTADPAPLPGDVAPAENYRIVAHPDGRVEVFSVAVAATPITVMHFNGTFSTTHQAELTVSVDGHVSGKLVLPP